MPADDQLRDCPFCEVTQLVRPVLLEHVAEVHLGGVLDTGKLDHFLAEALDDPATRVAVRRQVIAWMRSSAAAFFPTLGERAEVERAP